MASISSISSAIKARWRRSKSFRLVGCAVVFLLTASLVILPALSQQPVEISFIMLAPETPFFEPLIREFEEQNPDIRINMVEGPNEANLVEDLNTSAYLLGSSPYDLINLDVVWTSKFAAAGWLMDLGDRFPDERRAEFLEGDIEGSIYNDTLYRIPWRTDAGVLYYREDLLSEVGAQPPETFQEMVEIAKQVQEAGGAQFGYLWQGRQYEGVSAMFTEVLKGFGGYWINPDTNAVGLDEPEAIEAAQFLVDTIRDGVSPTGVSTYIEEDVRRLFQSGSAVFMRNWPYAIPLLNEDGSQVQGNVGTRPMLGTEGIEGGGCLGGWGWGISSMTPHPEEAWRVVEFFTSDAVQKRFALEAGFTPSVRSLYQDAEILAEYPYFSDLFEVVQNVAPRPLTAQYAQASDILQRYLSAAFSGRTNAEDALNAAARETRNLLGVAQTAATNAPEGSAPDATPTSEPTSEASPSPDAGTQPGTQPTSAEPTEVDAEGLPAPQPEVQPEPQADEPEAVG